MVEQYGNSIPAPGFKGPRKTGVNVEILYSTIGYTQKGVALKPGQGLLLAGTLLVQDSTSKEYIKWTGTGQPVGILRQSTETGSDAEADKYLGNVVITGMVQLRKIKAAHSGLTDTALAGAFTGSRVNTVYGYFKF